MTEKSPVCCHCDHDLSCAQCGMEQPYTDVSILRAQIAERDGMLSRWWNIGMNGAYGKGTNHPLCDHPIVRETLALLKGGSK